LGKDGSVLDDEVNICGTVGVTAEEGEDGGDRLGPPTYGVLAEAPGIPYSISRLFEPELWCLVLPNVGKTLGKEELKSPLDAEGLEGARLRQPPEPPGVRGRELEADGEEGEPGAVTGRAEGDVVAEVLLPRKREPGEVVKGERKTVTEVDET